MLIIDLITLFGGVYWGRGGVSFSEKLKTINFGLKYSPRGVFRIAFFISKILFNPQPQENDLSNLDSDHFL